MANPKKPLSEEAITLTPAIGCPLVVDVILPVIMPDGSREMFTVVCCPAVAATPETVLGM